MTSRQTSQPGGSASDASDLLVSWPNPAGASLQLLTPDSVLAEAGDTHRISNIASVSKLFASLTCLVAIEEGTIALDEPAGPEGSTVRHLLAHASGLAFGEHRSIASVGSRRIYSNAGIEQLADHVSTSSGMSFADYQRQAVIERLDLRETRLDGSPAYGVASTVNDLATLAQQLLRPTLIAESTLTEAVSSQFPMLRGVLPGFGSFDPNPWGLGIELRGTKTPHWTAPDCSDATFGHFGASGAYLWVDPTVGLACTAISGSDFGPWAVEAWPTTNQALLNRHRPSS